MCNVDEAFAPFKTMHECILPVSAVSRCLDDPCIDAKECSSKVRQALGSLLLCVTNSFRVEHCQLKERVCLEELERHTEAHGDLMVELRQIVDDFTRTGNCSRAVRGIVTFVGAMKHHGSLFHGAID